LEVHPLHKESDFFW